SAGVPSSARCDRLHRRVRPRPVADENTGADVRMGHAELSPRACPSGVGGRPMTTFTDEQEHLRDAVATLLAKRSDSAAVRAAMESELGYDADLWQTLCEQIGVAALAIPEQFGGAGAGLAEALVVLEELGRGLTPSPMLSS